MTRMIRDLRRARRRSGSGATDLPLSVTSCGGGASSPSPIVYGRCVSIAKFDAGEALVSVAGGAYPDTVQIISAQRNPLP